MTKSVAMVVVECDNCHDEDTIALTPLAGGGWDERNVDGCLKRRGWFIDGDRHFCQEECAGEFAATVATSSE